MLKAHFTILKTPPPFPFRAQVKLVIVYFVLHNYICLYDNQDEYALVEEERLQLDNKDDSYYLPTQVDDINLSMHQLKDHASWCQDENCSTNVEQSIIECVNLFIFDVCDDQFSSCIFLFCTLLC